jgi:hypothetical protein
MGGIAQGISAFGENRRRDRARSEDMAFREQSRQDMLAERATDNARADRQASQSEREWKASVLGSLGKRYAGEADLLEQAAAASGDPSLAAQAQGKRAEAQRYLTALDALVTGRGNGIPEMPAPPPPPPLHSMSAPVATAPAAGGGMNAAVDEVVGAAFAGGPGFFGPDGAYPAPSPVAASASAQGPLGITYTGDPVRDVKLADLMASRVNALRAQAGGKTWSRMSVERRNMMERAETEAVARKAQASFELDKAKKKMETDERIRIQAADDARKGATDADRLAKINEDRKAKGLDPIPDLSYVNPTAAAERQDKALEAKAAAAQERNAFKVELAQMQRRWEVEDRDVREGRMAAKDAAALANSDVTQAGAAVGRAQAYLRDLNDSYRAKPATPEELAEAQADLEQARSALESAVLRKRALEAGGGAPKEGSVAADPKQQVLEAFKALPPEKQTDEEMIRLLRAAGLR